MKDFDSIVSKYLEEVINSYPTLLDLSIRCSETKAYFSLWYWAKDEFEYEKTYDEVEFEL